MTGYTGRKKEKRKEKGMKRNKIRKKIEQCDWQDKENELEEMKKLCVCVFACWIFFF